MYNKTITRHAAFELQQKPLPIRMRPVKAKKNVG